jgi:ATP-dependent helicase/nuclease subunit A
MVDEYQDSNRVQDTIFNLLSPYEGSAFFVGDIKQSIYRFRKADPRIFAEKCRMAQSSPDCEYIAMNTNFRSRREVLEVCNYFFERSMTEGFGDVNYAEPGQGLDAGRASEGNLPSELCLLDTPSLKQDSDSEEGVSTAEAEAEFVASRIRDMLESRACTVPEKDGVRRARASDFAILLSSYKGKAPIFQKALAARGLDSDAEREQEDPFGSVEGSIIISLLRIVSNRRQDIPLLSVMRSPLFAFDAEEIAELRAKNTSGDLWDSVFWAARGGNAKAQRLVSELDHLTEVAKDLSCAGFLQYVYARFGAYGLFSALGDAPKRAATLDLLYETALNCEKGSFAHVSKLVEHIDRRTAKKSPAAPAGDGVRIMSIHKSKGLEFPFVFVCDLCKEFNTDDVETDVLLHTEKGLALRRADKRLRTRTATKKRFIISRQILSELRAEELRKLYVAMTRAREKLFLVVSSGRSTVEKTVAKTYERSGDIPSEQFYRSQSSASRWLIAALFGHPGAAFLRSCLPGEHPAEEENLRSLICSQIVTVSARGGATMTSNGQTEGIEAEFDPMEYLPVSELGYRFDHISRLPSKITPSGARLLQDEVERRVYFAPAEDAGAQGLTAAEKGTRVHELLSCITPTADLTADQVMEAFSDCEREDAEMASGFYRSALGRQAAEANECLREYQFSVLLTPRELELGEEDDEFILLNGSIDMLLITPEGMVIADFKTDSVKAGEEAAAAEKHRKQLDIYALAAEKIFLLPVLKKSVFFLKTATEAVL